jgi:ABC-2 type transport system permease protein
MPLYFRLISVRIRSQLQYRLSFAFETLGMGLQVYLEFLSLVLVFSRFGSVGGWTLAEVAFLWGLAESAFGTMDLLFSGFDPSYFAGEVQRGRFDQFLLRPMSLPLQMFTAEFILRRVGRISNGLLILAYSIALADIAWTPAKLLYLPVVFVSTVAFFGGLFVLGATFCFWTVESIEVINIFTYGGTAMMSYPMHIYDDWLRRFFLSIVPAGLLVYYPSLFFLGKPDPLGLPPFAPFLAPVAGFGVLALAFGLWNAGVRKYTSTGT